MATISYPDSRSRASPSSQRRPICQSRTNSYPSNRRRKAQRHHHAIFQARIRRTMSVQSELGSSPIPSSLDCDSLPSLHPRAGLLVPLPSRAEAQALLTLADAYVLEVPAKGASDILAALDQIVSKDKSITLSHLRRFARAGSLPRYVQDRLRMGKPQLLSSSGGGLELVDLNKLSISGHKPEQNVKNGHETETLFLLVGLTRLVTVEAITTVLKNLGMERELLRTRVPISPPMNPSLARDWSDLYWPTQYRKSTPLGPHPTVVRQGTDNINSYSGFWMSQVIETARQGRKKGMGPAIGALIVDSKDPLAPAPVAIAADGRYGLLDGTGCPKDNVMNHAVMRAIGIVGRKRMSLATPPRVSPENHIVLDYPILESEKKVFETQTLPSGGYLCTGLDIYLTHEPCVMCAQAILHSRFEKVVFRRRMSKTGAATPERPGSENSGLGYGLFWRPELNWRLLVWEWKDTETNEEDGVISSTHA